MFIDRHLRIPTRGSEGRNETRLVHVKLISAPPNRAGGSGPLSYNISPLRGEIFLVFPKPYF